MWDMTNISEYKFENTATQRATWNDYYAENCFKAGIGNILCGWILNEDLWGGGANGAISRAQGGKGCYFAPPPSGDTHPHAFNGGCAIVRST